MSPRGLAYKTTYTYDNNGFLATELGAEGSLRQFDYDLRGRLLSQIDANGHTTHFTYDSLDRLTKRTDPDTVSVTYAYDDKGNKTQETTRQGIVIDTVYDERDRVSSASRSGLHISNGSKAYAYDKNGNLLSESDWKGLATTHTYDALNRRETTTNRDNQVMSYGYDRVGNTTSQTDFEGRQATFVYDDLDRLKTSTQISATWGNRVTQQGYDNEGNVLSVIDANLRQTQYLYDARNLRTQQINADAKVYQWNYDEVGNLLAEINENLVSTSYAYDKQNRRIEMRRNDGSHPDYVTQYGYDANGNLNAVIDPRNNQRTTTYDELNRPLIETDFGGFASNYNYSEAGRIVTVTDARFIARITEFDGLERVIRQTQGDGGFVLNQYDVNGNTTQTTDARGTVTAIAYDVLDRPTTITQGQGSAVARTLGKEYDRVGNLTADIDGRNLRTEYTYDDFNQLITSKDPAPFNTTQSFSYDKVGNKLSETDRRGHTTTFVYDRLNRLTTVTDPAPFSYTLAYTYDAVGNRLTEKDKRGTLTTHVYDKLNRLTQSSKPDGLGNTVLLVRNEYDGNNNVTAITDANNHRTELSYTARNQLDTTTFADTTTTTHTYDDVGNRLTETDEALQTSTYTYDNENRLATETNHAQEVTGYSYDTNGNRLTATQPKQNGWTYSYDALNRLQTVANSLGHTTAYEYDANDNQTAQVDAESKRVEYAYDELNRRTQHTQIKATGNLVVASIYDENGNLASRTDAKNQTISYVYDELNRETSRTYPVDNGPFIDIQGIASQYDANNNIASITETKTGALGALSDLTSNTYDLLDRLKSSTQRGKTINYGYDNNGNRISVGTAAGSTTYTFDKRNRIETAINGGTTTYSYYADGKQQQITYPNGTQSRYGYDAADRVNDIVTETSANQSLIARYQYLYDTNGNRTEQQETQNGQLETTSYTYDSADRMESYSIVAGANTTTTRYTFDAVSNRLTEVTTENAVTTVDKSYTYDDTHWLDKVTDNLQSQDIVYTYDANGNTVQKLDNTQSLAESTVFTYNPRDQLVQTQRGPPASETQTLGQYDYNYAGLRTRHYQSERGNVQYFYDDQAVIEERSDSDALIAHYRYADRLLSLQTAVETSFYHHDALGSTTNLTDTAGATKVSYKLDPWGHIREQVGSSVNRQVFTGQEMDEQTGLIYFGARFYDPESARFINQDSYLGESLEPPSLHRYLYAYANPTVYIDLFGYESEKTNNQTNGSGATTLTPKANALEEGRKRREALLKIKGKDPVKVSDQQLAEIRLERELEKNKETYTEETKKGLEHIKPIPLDGERAEQLAIDALKRTIERETGLDKEKIEELNTALEEKDVSKMLYLLGTTYVGNRLDKLTGDKRKKNNKKDEGSGGGDLNNVFYRRMSQAEYDLLVANDGELTLKPGKKTTSYVTQSRNYVDSLNNRKIEKDNDSESYAVLVKFNVAPGTVQQLLRKSALENKNKIIKRHLKRHGVKGRPNLKGKGDDVVALKSERGSITYGLRRKTVVIFNRSILSYEKIE